MIPFHGIRSSFGTRLAFFFFLAALHVAVQKLYLGRLGGGKVFGVGRDRTGCQYCGIRPYCRYLEIQNEGEIACDPMTFENAVTFVPSLSDSAALLGQSKLAILYGFRAAYTT